MRHPDDHGGEGAASGHGDHPLKRSAHDRRSIHVRLTDKGRTLRDRLSDMHRRHIEMLGQTPITDADLQGVVTTLRQLERFWLRGSDLS